MFGLATKVLNQAKAILSPCDSRFELKSPRLHNLQSLGKKIIGDLDIEMAVGVSNGRYVKIPNVSSGHQGVVPIGSTLDPSTVLFKPWWIGLDDLIFLHLHYFAWLVFVGIEGEKRPICLIIKAHPWVIAR